MWFRYETVLGYLGNHLVSMIYHGQYLLEIQAMISFLGNGADGETHIHSVCEADEFDCR